MLLCPNCGSQQPDHAKFCDECGVPLRGAASGGVAAGGGRASAVTHPPTVPASSVEIAPLGQACGRCGTQLEPDSAFCHHCGAPVDQGAQPSPPTLQVPPPATSQGQTPPSLRVVVGPHQIGLRFPPGRNEIVLGRNDPVAKVFPDFDLTPYNGADLGVSRRHARLFFERGQLYIEDNASTNHTHVRGDQIERRCRAHTPVPLASGDEVRLGRLVLVIFVEPSTSGQLDC